MERNYLKYCETHERPYKIFWRSDYNPFGSNIYESWTPYDEGDCQFLEKCYQIFLKDKSKEEVTLGQPPEYKINFKHWMQINIQDRFRQRPIKRDLPSNMQNIVRFNRFNVDVIHENQPNMNILNNGENDSYAENVLKKGYVTKLFRIIPEKPIEILIPEKLDFFKSIEKPKTYKYFKEEEVDEITNFGEFLFSLHNEINDLSKYSEFQKKQNPYDYKEWLNKITKENFYEVYTEEGFLYREINKILRNFNNNEFPLICYYYTSLIAAITYYSQQSFENMKNDKIMNEGEIYLNLYRGGGISENEIKAYEMNKDSLIIRQYFEFMSTSFNRKKAEAFIKISKSKNKALYIIEVPNNVKSFGNTVVYLGNLSVYEDERECLIKSGSLLKIENITKNNEGIFIVKSKLMSGGYKGFCEYLEQDYKGEILDLSHNNLGNLDIDKITSLSNALMKNKTITTLKLSDNKLWWHDANTKNVKILAEALINNKTITTVNMSRNWCDKKRMIIVK